MISRLSEGPSIGRLVHYVLPSGKHRPAQVVEVHELGLVNLVVTLDGTNDPGIGSADRLQAWVVAVPYDDAAEVVGTWHWPERVP